MGAVLLLSPDSVPPRVLVVDDVSVNRAMLVRLLAAVGFVVAEAENGEQAVEVAQAWLPDAVLMDLQMPLLDGLGATRAIKRASWGAAIAVIIVSGSSREANVADALAAGAFGFISKPFLDAEILAALGNALGLVYG